MSIWERYSVEQRVHAILSDQKIPRSRSNPAPGRPFLNAYQIAIELERRFPADAIAIGKRVGGKGTGERDSLAKYLSRQLKKRINSGNLRNMETAYLGGTHLDTLRYRTTGGIVESSLGRKPMAVYRLIL